MQEDYDNFLKLSKILENTKKCKKCKRRSLVHCDFQEHYLICQDCGILYRYNEKTKRLVIC